MDIFWCVLIAVDDNKMHKEKAKLIEKIDVIKKKLDKKGV
jgi:hypothetical protein